MPPCHTQKLTLGVIKTNLAESAIANDDRSIRLDDESNDTIEEIFGRPIRLPDR